MDKSGWVYGDVDLDLVHKVRSEGMVRNFRDWPEQDSRNLTPEIVDLRLRADA